MMRRLLPGPRQRHSIAAGFLRGDSISPENRSNVAVLADDDVFLV
jgi:hypothetical protein